MGRSIAWVVVALGVGFALGWVAHRPEAPATDRAAAAPPAPPPPPVRDAPAMPAAADAREAPVLPGGRAPPAPPAPPAPGGLPIVPAAPAARDTPEIAALRARLAELERKNADEVAARVEREGQPVKRPEDLPARFESEALRHAVEDAFKQVGVDAQVTAVDCSEFPCLVTGETTDAHFDRKLSEKLSQAGALSPYGDDARYSFGADSKGADGRTHQEFGIAVFPHSMDDQKVQIQKRLTTRWNDVLDSLRGR